MTNCDLYVPKKGDFTGKADVIKSRVNFLLTGHEASIVTLHDCVVVKIGYEEAVVYLIACNELLR